ncbi:Hydroxyisourate hydrolase [Sporormia fimetaria CBS 119925]|uniref:hydroxyisourate hydrolase n=1 Tax=Sporormia fimetaria CBS 119925 TaxID=1340428 RepID=A0A6A6VCJ7_9PLEO|nr:Hydroxyisourate hydrolase [Sporormia fimetaria CBS 119925]
MTNPTNTPATTATTTTTTTSRLTAITQHLTPPTLTMSTPATRPPITTHALDTSAGRPATSIPVTLTLHNPPSTLSPNELVFKGETNSDGRVTFWTPSSPFSADGLDVVFKRGGDQKYSLRFDVEEYWNQKGVKAFMNEVVLSFVVRDCQKSEHFHVPVLLGPFGFTTYRGS